MQPIPMMATGTGGEGANEFKSFTLSSVAIRSPPGFRVAGCRRLDEGAMLGEDQSVLNLVDLQGRQPRYARG